MTDDHIPPKCLFGQKGKLPADLITVRACEQCNLKSSGDDEYLRLALAPSAEASQHPVANSLMPVIARSLKRPEAAGFARSFVENVTVVNAFTPNGIFIGKALRHELDNERLNRIISKIVRGLFFKEYAKRLPVSHRVWPIFANFPERHSRKDEFEVWRYHIWWSLLPGGNDRSIGHNAFIYRCNRDPTRMFRTVWALTFYGNLHFFAFTSSQSDFELRLNEP